MSDIDIAAIKEQVKTLFTDVSELKTDIKEIKQQLANRLPLWVTILISGMGTVIGYLVAFLKIKGG